MFPHSPQHSPNDEPRLDPLRRLIALRTTVGNTGVGNLRLVISETFPDIDEPDNVVSSVISSVVDYSHPPVEMAPQREIRVVPELQVAPVAETVAPIDDPSTYKQQQNITELAGQDQRLAAARAAAELARNEDLAA